MDEIRTIITFTIDSAEIKATSNFLANLDVVEVTQAIGENLFPIENISISEEGYKYEWHTNPL